MRTYGQYCPIAWASEILAERWTPIILRNLLHGPPGLARALPTWNRRSEAARQSSSRRG